MTDATSPSAQSSDVTPYRHRIADVANRELDHNEPLVAATRLVLPVDRSRYDAELKERDNLRDLPLLQHFMLVFRPPPKPVAGFPLAWSMVVGLTRHRVLVWKPQRNSEQPGAMLGAVQLDDFERIDVVTIPDRKGRTLGLKIALDNGPRILLDVVAGFRADTEHFAEQAQHHIEVVRFLR